MFENLKNTKTILLCHSHIICEIFNFQTHTSPPFTENIPN